MDRDLTVSTGDSAVAAPLDVTSDLYIGGVPVDNAEVMLFIRTNRLTYTVQQSEW